MPSAPRCCSARSGARVIFVDYLTLLPPGRRSRCSVVNGARRPGVAWSPHAWRKPPRGLHRPTGCEVVRAGHASRHHHGWSADPWAVAAGLPLPWRPAPFHPNAAGMRAVAGLILEADRRSLIRFLAPG